MKGKIKSLGKIFLASLLVLSLLLVAGCDSSADEKAPATQVTEQKEKAPAAKAEAPKKESQAEEISVIVYYPNADGTKLVPTKRYVTLKSGEDKYTAAMKSLMQGTENESETNIIPKKAKLNSVTVKGNVATVDFSRDLVKYFVGGSTGEAMLVGSVVNTLTEFSEIEKVKITIDGESVETLSGHMDLTEPFARMKKLL